MAWPSAPFWLTAANIAFGLVGLAVTLALEIPRHARLETHGRDDRVITELVRFNCLARSP